MQTTTDPAPPGLGAQVAVIGQLRFEPGHLPAIWPHLHALVEATNRLDGCLLYRACEDPLEPGLLRFSELWPDQATFAGHLVAPHVAPWREAVQRVGLLERHFMVFDITGAREL